MQQFEVTFQKYNSCIPRTGRCRAKDPSSLVTLLMKHGIHAITYHEVPENPDDIRHIEIGKGGRDEIKQGREVC